MLKYFHTTLNIHRTGGHDREINRQGGYIIFTSLLVPADSFLRYRDILCTVRGLFTLLLRSTPAVCRCMPAMYPFRSPYAFATLHVALPPRTWVDPYSGLRIAVTRRNYRAITTGIPEIETKTKKETKKSESEQKSESKSDFWWNNN